MSQYGPESGLHVTLMSRASAERFTRRAYGVPDHVGLGWTPYRIIVQYRALPHTAFVRVREFRRWLGSKHRLQIIGRSKAMRLGHVVSK